MENDTILAWFHGFFVGMIICGLILLLTIPGYTGNVNKFGLSHGFAHYDTNTGELIRDSLIVKGDTIFVIRR